MKLRISISAAGLALVASLLAQTKPPVGGADKERALANLVTSDDPVTDLPIAMWIDYSPVANGRYYVPIMAKIPGSALEAAVQSGADSTTIDYIGVVKDAAGTTVAHVRDFARFKLSGVVAAGINRPIEYDSAFTLDPGNYSLRFVAREDTSGKIGTYESRFTIPVQIAAVQDVPQFNGTELARTAAPLAQGIMADGAAWQMFPIGTAIASAWEAPLVSGHPYSAAARTVTLSPDGAHVDRAVTQLIYRDDQGRTRRELDGGKNISILDPTASVAYDLNPETKTATKRALQPVAIAPQTKVPSQSLFEIATAQAKSRPNMAVEDLGTQVVNGVSAQGVRMTTTIAAGTVGNDRDLKTVVDRWVSTDLHVLVKSVTTDSRTGATTYELTNVVLGSPDPSLFQVPAGYTIQEGGGRRGGPAPGVPAAGRGGRN